MDDKSSEVSVLNEEPEKDVELSNPDSLSGDVPNITLGTKKNFWVLYKLPIIIGVVLALCILVTGLLYATFINPSDKRLSQVTTTPTPDISVSGAVTLVPSDISITPSVTITPTPGFQVTSVFVAADNLLVNSCTNTFNYTGQIIANGAGTVVYQWIRSDGGTDSPVTLVFTTAGVKTVGNSWAFGCSGTCDNWMKLMVTVPNVLESDQVTSSLVCSADDFSGDWYHNFGTAHIEQSGNIVTGNYLNKVNTPVANGNISANSSGSNLSGTWNVGGGSGSLMWVKSGNTFSGNLNGSYIWCGAKAGNQLPSNCSFTGDWKIKLSESDVCPGGNMNLVVSIGMGGDYNVSGTYCNGSVTGAVTFADGTAVLNGSWSDGGGGSGSFKFWLVEAYNAQQFRGHYTSGANQHEWCGWRSGSSQPGTCLK